MCAWRAIANLFWSSTSTLCLNDHIKQKYINIIAENFSICRLPSRISICPMDYHAVTDAAQAYHNAPNISKAQSNKDWDTWSILSLDFYQWVVGKLCWSCSWALLERKLNFATSTDAPELSTEHWEHAQFPPHAQFVSFHNSRINYSQLWHSIFFVFFSREGYGNWVCGGAAADTIVSR